MVNNNLIFGVTVGVGLDIKLSKSITLFTEGTFNPDFSNLCDYTNSYGYSYKLKNTSFDIKTGIKF